MPKTVAPAMPRSARAYLWLSLMVGTFVAVSIYGGTIAYYNLAIAAAHAYDLGIFEQAFWATSQGYHVPFYEATDCIVKGRCSFLIVHPSFVLYPLVPFYSAFPTPITLFVERSLIVGLAAVPLYWMTRQVTHSETKSLFAAGLFLVWAPTLSGDLFSFHVESFIPLELFTMIALWQGGRYRWGLLVAAVSFITLEVAPVFVFFIGLFFLAPEIESLLRDAARRWKATKGQRGRWTGGPRDLAHSVRQSLGRREIRYTVILMIFAVAGYVLANLFLNEYGAGLLGVPRPPVPAGLAGVFFNNSQKGTTGNLGVAVTSPNFVWNVEYWLILYGLLAFLPLLNLRSFVIVGVPWIAYSMLNTVHRFTTIGSQYSLLAAVPIFLGLAYALARVDFHAIPWIRPSPGGGAGTPEDRSVVRPALTRRRRRIYTGWMVLLGVLVVANLVLSPMVPLIPDTVGHLGAPFDAYYFEPWLTIQPGFAAVEQLIALIPSHQSLGVSNDLLPLVANNLYAYNVATIPINFEGFPFNYSAGPDWVLTAMTSEKGGGYPLNTQLPQLSLYQLRGYVAVSTQGPILLYERGYVGPAQLFGPPATPPNESWTPADGLTLGPAGVVSTNLSPSGGNVYATNGSLTKVGLLAHSEAGFLPPYSYTLTALLNRTSVAVPPSGTTRVLDIRVLGFSGLAWQTNVTVAELPAGIWTTLTFTFTLGTPAPDAEVDVMWENTHCPFELASMSVAGTN
jgi:uncharacterized membrane protein